jgi:dTDP-4-amino-4,6-dideoxygalactose transaminase
VKVPLLDLRAQYATLKEEIMAATREVYESQQFILGPKVKELEEKIAEYCRCPYAVGVSSGTDALVISLMTAGIGSGDLVVTTPFTFFATVGSITRVGATPLFVDIDRTTYNMDPSKLESALNRLTPAERSRVKAIMPVHLFGQCAEMEPILETVKKYNWVVIEDAAHAIGAEVAFKSGALKRAGSMGEYGCFSFFPSKNLGAFGDGGMVTTNSKELYERLTIMRGHGAKPKYYHRVIGGNFRLDALQAAILTVKLKYLDQWTAGRQENAKTYRELFQKSGLTEVTLPVEKEGRHIYNQFVIRLKGRRDELREFLNAQGIGTEVYYPLPLHVQDCFKYLGHRPEDFQESVDAAATTLALPIYPELKREQLEVVVQKIKEFVSIPR